jgi:hypothetical protein
MKVYFITLRSVVLTHRCEQRIQFCVVKSQPLGKAVLKRCVAELENVRMKPLLTLDEYLSYKGRLESGCNVAFVPKSCGRLPS